jgi:hypothetical protein
MFIAMLEIITKITAEDSGGVLSSCSTNDTASHSRRKISSTSSAVSLLQDWEILKRNDRSSAAF